VDFLDVGCGTGIGARRYKAAGCTVLGVDPDSRMAGVARRSGIEVEIGNFETWDPGGRSFDAVVAGQAWHWVDPVLGARKAAQLLRPNGLLALYWHVFDPPGDVATAFDDVMRRVAPDAPLQNPGLQLQEGNLKRAVEGIRTAGGFGEPDQWRYEWQREYTREEWLDHLPSSHRTSSQPCWNPWEPPSTRSGVASPCSTSPWRPPRHANFSPRKCN